MLKKSKVELKDWDQVTENEKYIYIYIYIYEGKRKNNKENQR